MVAVSPETAACPLRVATSPCPLFMPSAAQIHLANPTLLLLKALRAFEPELNDYRLTYSYKTLILSEVKNVGAVITLNFYSSFRSFLRDVQMTYEIVYSQFCFTELKSFSKNCL